MTPPNADRHEQAFERYYALGEKRTYRQVATDLGVSLSTVKQWSRKHRWKERIAERDAEAARQVADTSLQTTIEDNARNKKIVQMAMVKLARAIADGRIKMQLADLDRLIKLQSYIDGYHEGQTWDSLSPEELAQRFYYVLQNLPGTNFDRFIAEYKRLQKSHHPATDKPD